MQICKNLHDQGVYHSKLLARRTQQTSEIEFLNGPRRVQARQLAVFRLDPIRLIEPFPASRYLHPVSLYARETAKDLLLTMQILFCLVRHDLRVRVLLLMDHLRHRVVYFIRNHHLQFGLKKPRLSGLRPRPLARRITHHRVLTRDRHSDHGRDLGYLSNDLRPTGRIPILES